MIKLKTTVSNAPDCKQIEVLFVFFYELLSSLDGISRDGAADRRAHSDSEAGLSGTDLDGLTLGDNLWNFVEAFAWKELFCISPHCERARGVEDWRLAV